MIDGTGNFIAGIPIWCVSMGLVIDDQPVLGIVYNPTTEELHAGRIGDGAYLNGKRIRVSTVRRLEEARRGLGFSYRRARAGACKGGQRVPGGELRIYALRFRGARHGVRRGWPTRRLLRGPN